MSSPSPRSDMQERLPVLMSHHLLVTVSVVAFAIRDWSLWILLRDGPYGPPMRVVQGEESVTDAVERVLDVLFAWPRRASSLQLKAGWQEQQIAVWGSPAHERQHVAVSLIHSVLLRANREALRPDLDRQLVPSLHVSWIPVTEVELGHKTLDPDILPLVETALHILRSQVQRNPETVLRYLADMKAMSSTEQESTSSEDEPERGDGTLTLAEAAMLYRAFFAPDEPIDLSNLRRRFMATNLLFATDEERPVRGREADWRRVGRVYHYGG
jgi:hypothetical protein